MTAVSTAHGGRGGLTNSDHYGADYDSWSRYGNPGHKVDSNDRFHVVLCEDTISAVIQVCMKSEISHYLSS